MTDHQLAAGDYSDDDVAEFRGRMNDLLAECAALSRRYAPDGTWRPSTEGVLTEQDNARQLIAELSRALSRTRKGLRSVEARARQRRVERGHPLEQHF